MKQIYKVKYENGCITVDVDFNEIRICGNGDVYSEVGSGVYEVSGLYTSLCEYFKNNLPGRLTLESYENVKFEVDGGWVKIKSGALKERIEIGDAVVEFDGDDLWLTHKEVMLHEVCEIRFERFTNEMYAGEVIRNATAVNDGNELILETRWGEILRISKHGVQYSKDFCLLFGEIENESEILKWLENVAREMEYYDTNVLKIGSWIGFETHIFEWGFWEIEFEKDGEFKRMRLDDNKVLAKITKVGMIISKGGARKAINLMRVFEEKKKISEIFQENNKILKSLIF